MKNYKRIITPEEAKRFTLGLCSFNPPRYPLDMFFDYKYYQLERIDIATLFTDPTSYAQMITTDTRKRLQHSKIPANKYEYWENKYKNASIDIPLVYGGGMMFDGSHRLALAILRGDKTILAYIGKLI